MILRRKPLSGFSTCSRCVKMRIYVFWGVSILLLVALVLQPVGAVQLARLMPSPIAIGLFLTGMSAIIFAYRLRAFVRELNNISPTLDHK